MSGPLRVLLAGYFGAGNLGDEAILASTLAQLRDALGEAFLPVVAAYDPAWIRAFHGEVETVDVWDIRALAAAVGRSDLVVWGGGGLLQDHWYVPAEELLLDARGGVPAHLRVPLLAVLKGVPCMMYGQGVGPLSHPESRRAAALVCSALAAITVRDQASAELLRDCGVRGVQVTVSADPALATVPSSEATALALLQAAGLDQGRRPLVAVTPRIPPDGSRHWVEPLLAALRSSVLDNGGAVAFVAFDHRPEGDEALCRELAEGLGGPPGAAAFASVLQPADCTALLGACDAVVATRLHGLVLAAVAGTPAVALDYDPKVRAFAEELGGAVSVIPLTGLDADRLASEIGDTMASGPDRQSRIREATAELRAREALNLQTALRLLVRAGAPRTAVASAEPPDTGTPQVELDAARLTLEASARREVALEAERAELLRQLGMLRGSRVVRLVEAYWRWAGQEPGRRRGIGRVVGGVHRLLLGRRAAPREAAPKPVEPEVPLSPLPPEVPTPGPWSDLPAFEQAMRARGASGVALVLSGTKLLESEGQRPMQLALALARRGVAVVFAYWRWSPDDWCPQDRLDQGVLQVPLDVLTAAPEAVLERFGWSPRRLLMIEFPHPTFLPVLAQATQRGWTAVYDVLDDWAEFHRVGQAIWYDEAVEREVLRGVSLVSVVTPALEQRLRGLGSGRVAVVPNGLRPDIVQVRDPVQLERGEITVGYFGYLAGAWFDWELVLAAARARPGWRFYLIGYGGAPEGQAVPDNVALLGKQPQSALAAFAAWWDVGIVPFKAETLAAGADPIKTYEYLAMGLPVVVTGVSAPAGAEELVARADRLDGFLGAIEQAVQATELADRRRAWASGETWDARLDRLLAHLADPPR